MPKPRRTALIFVPQDWFNSSLAHLLPPRPRSPNAEVHQLQTDLWEQADQGIWLKDVRETRLRRQDGSAVAPLDVLVPWRFILTVAFVNDVEDVQLGFAAENVTVLSQ